MHQYLNRSSEVRNVRPNIGVMNDLQKHHHSELIDRIQSLEASLEKVRQELNAYDFNYCKLNEQWEKLVIERDKLQSDLMKRDEVLRVADKALNGALETVRAYHNVKPQPGSPLEQWNEALTAIHSCLGTTEGGEK